MPRVPNYAAKLRNLQRVVEILREGRGSQSMNWGKDRPERVKGYQKPKNNDKVDPRGTFIIGIGGTPLGVSGAGAGINLNAGNFGFGAVNGPPGINVNPSNFGVGRVMGPGGIGVS